MSATMAPRGPKMARRRHDNLPPDPANDPPSRKLYRLVQKDGRSYPEIAEAAGMSESQLSQTLNGHVADPRFSTVRRILKALGLRWEDYENA